MYAEFVLIPDFDELHPCQELGPVENLADLESEPVVFKILVWQAELRVMDGQPESNVR